MYGFLPVVYQVFIDYFVFHTVYLGWQLVGLALLGVLYSTGIAKLIYESLRPDNDYTRV